MSLDLDPRDDLQRLAPYLTDFAEAVLAEGGGDTALLCAIALRETLVGWAPGYVVPPGAPRHLGRGDHGHGFGLFQIDDRGPYAHLPRECPEATPHLQARWACTVLRDARRELGAFAARLLFERGVVAAYNAGSPAVARCFRLGLNPDTVTTAGTRFDPPRPDYGEDVLLRRDELRMMHPGTFPSPAERVA